MQSRLTSLIEANINTFTGFIINWCAGFVIYPLAGMSVDVLDVTTITLLFTVLSVARNYLIRRFFNKDSSVVSERKTYHLCAEGCQNVSKISDTRTKILPKHPHQVETLKQLLNQEIPSCPKH